MKFVTSLWVACAALSSHVVVVVADDKTTQALRDMQIGMQGLMQAANDPELLAQLLQDLQDPEMMEEAKKMMENSEYQKQMKKLTNSKEFKESIKATTDMLNDPNAAAHAEAKLEHMAKVGAQQLKDGATNAMDQALQQALNNPEVMAEMAKMVQDPSFAKQFKAMQNDPAFKNYMEAMSDMLKDPSKKAKLQAATEALKASL